MDLGLKGSAAVVTGGSKGMGRAIAEAFADDGAKVAILARGAEAIDETLTELRRRGCPDAMGISVDLTDPSSIDEAFATIGDRWGAVNSLVNTLGPGDGTFDALDDAGWDTALQLGLMAAVRCTRAALPLLRQAEWARIVNFAAHSIQRQNPQIVAYTASKAALTSVSKNLAKSLAPEGILVNTVSPGTIVTASFTENLDPFLKEDGLDSSNPVDVMTWIEKHFHQPADLGRAGLPEEIASITVYLASRRNGYVTGANVNVDGGSDFI
ncbi:SDR family NAD(P)-dependent oxidoreductase [Aquihabitans sp. McL0605]|uniref:SDR family NAD(P)-dependent oxidoreductase n=1 Tax=Aquihabitans sp. McL0605 TaxID=3415671 RepID=UPI003CEBB07C